jgi:hypothetical protein
MDIRLCASELENFNLDGKQILCDVVLHSLLCDMYIYINIKAHIT